MSLGSQKDTISLNLKPVAPRWRQAQSWLQADETVSVTTVDGRKARNIQRSKKENNYNLNDKNYIFTNTSMILITDLRQ